MNRWLAACKAETAQDLKELFLMEQFRSCVSHDLEVYIAERGPKTVQEAAVLADQWEVIHYGGIGRGGPSRGSERRSLQVGSRPDTRPASDGSRSLSPGSGSTRGPLADGGQGSASAEPVICYGCGKPGHIRRYCPAGRGRADRERVVSLVAAHTSGLEVVVMRQGVGVKEGVASSAPFVSSGTVALEQGGEEVEVQILRDTGASQTLLAAGVLDLPLHRRWVWWCYWLAWEANLDPTPFRPSF